MTYSNTDCHKHNNERNGSWGASMQAGNLAEIEPLGSKLSLEIECAVHFPAYGKNMFECKCGVTFPLFIVQAGNWKEIREIHKNGRR